MAEICNFDCFQCPHPDCIRDYVPAKALEESKAVDALIERKNKRRLYDAQRRAAYYAANRERILQYQREYRKNNPDIVKAAQARWRREHREELNAKKREYRERKRKETLDA